MRRLSTLSALIAFSFISANVAAAQGVDAFFGLGTARAKSTGVPIDTFGTGTLYNTPSLGGTFLKFGGDLMLTPHFGAGVEGSVRATQADYAGLKYKPTFYDFNAIWRPFAPGSRIVPELQAGIGGANLKFYYTQQFCDQFAGCSTQNSFLESSNHFQTHFAAGINFYVTSGIFIRPQAELHWVHNFFQFGTDWVPEYSASSGYTFGRR